MINTKCLPPRSIFADRTNGNNGSNVSYNRNGLKGYSLWPSVRDVRADRSKNLRPVKTVGPYASCSEYSSIQFHLLREELLSPLKKITDEIQAEKFHYKFYENPNVYLRGAVFHAGTHGYFELTMSKSYVEDPEEESRLTVGSLLCLSSDFFNRSFVFAEVKKSLPSLSLNEVARLIHVKNWSEASGLLARFQELIVLESPTFYESVKHTLKKLSNVEELERILLNKYIISVNSDVDPPPYLTDDTCYNFEDVLPEEFVQSSSSTRKWSGVPLLKMSPSHKASLSYQLKLDHSQFSAYYGALTQQVALIQGPPGTGKTHVGLLIIKTLLANRSLWQKESLCPILILCFKNAALDQFLEGVLSFCRKIGRIGGQCKSERLKKFVIKGNKFWKLSKQRLQVIGMTVTGAAKYSYLFPMLKPRIVVVEEAAEVLECHLYAALCETIDHVILIGDHKQLRPLVTDCKLSSKYNFDVSMFERLVTNKLPCQTLNVQHRMKESISQVIRETRFYKKYKDSASVRQFPTIPLFDKNLFFMDHSHSEKHGTLNSITNSFEANFLLELVKFFAVRNSQKRQITILTPYKAQKELINQRLKGQLHLAGQSSIMSLAYAKLSLRVCTVDEFQGEESDIVLLSFVRSNKDNNIGFLKTPNRVCVALTRAKYCMIALGNFTMMANCNRTWKRIVNYLEKAEKFGSGLLLKPLPTEEPIVFEKVKDFKKFASTTTQDPRAVRLL